jgi:putative ABC transport system ATP-binding protein
MPLIQLTQVHKYHRLGETRIAALQGIDLTIHSGEFVAIWGPSGSGKSTLCNLIGLLDSATSGTVLFEGQDVTALSDDQRSTLRGEAIGFVFQSFNLLPVLSALENVMLPLQIQRVRPAQVKAKAIRRLTDLGLAEHMTHRPNKLSGGQQQRVAIARALITDPALVIADEPTANLDSETALKIIDLMRHLNGQHGTTFVFATHDRRLLERVNRQVLLRDGTIIEDTTVSVPPALVEGTDLGRLPC